MTDYQLALIESLKLSLPRNYSCGVANYLSYCFQADDELMRFISSQRRVLGVVIVILCRGCCHRLQRVVGVAFVVVASVEEGRKRRERRLGSW